MTKGRSRNRHCLRGHGPRPLQRCRRNQASAQTRPRPSLQLHSRLRLRSAYRHRTARRNARPAASRKPLAAGIHRLRRHRSGRGRHSHPARSMVSTIANGGTYLPPHILMPGQDPVPSDPVRQPPLPPGTNLERRRKQVPQICIRRLSRSTKICPIPSRPARIASSANWLPPKCAR